MSEGKEQLGANQPPKSNPNRRNRRRSNKEKAESQFDSSAPPKTLEKFFSEVIEEKRENVDIELHLDIDDRLIDGYDEKIESFVELQPFTEEKSLPLIARRQQDLKAMCNVAIAKKLWTATPDSEKTQVEHLKYLRNYNVDLPKSINIAVDHLGKITEEEWICRIKWNSLTIERFLFRAIISASYNSDFADTYLQIKDKDAFQQIDVDSVITTSNDSVQWLRDRSKIVLKDIMSKEFEVKIGTGNDRIKVCMPQLEFSKDVEVDRANVIAWMNKITVNHVNWETAIGAAIIRLITPQWIERRKSKLSDIDDMFIDTLWKDVTISKIFKDLKIYHIQDIEGFKLRDATGSFLFYYQKKSLPFFKRIFNISSANQSSSFGSKSQLIVLTGKNNYRILDKRATKLNLVGSSAEGSSYFKVKDKSAIVHQMIYGFTKSLEISENYKYRTNGSPDSIKSTNLSSDFREY